MNRKTRRMGLATGAIVVAMLFIASMFSQVQASLYEEEAPPAYPCAAGERVSTWSICLHGTVFGPDEQPVDGATIVVAYQGKSVSGITSIHPGEILPTYGIDIGLLEPEYLQPLFVTASLPGMNGAVQRQVQIFPDFNNRNQRFDISFADAVEGDARPKDVRIWGLCLRLQQRRSRCKCQDSGAPW